MAIAALAVQAYTVATMPTTIEKVPFLLKENTETGEISSVYKLDHTTWTPSNTTEEYFIGHYINIRERFEQSSLDVDYIDVQLFSSQDIANTYVGNMTRDKGVIEFFERTPGEREVFIKSISWIERNLVQVRFSTTDKYKVKVALPETKHFSVILGYEFTPDAVPDKEEYRRKNLVGFHVSKYTITTESSPTWER